MSGWLKPLRSGLLGLSSLMLTSLCHLDHEGRVGRQISEEQCPVGGAELVTHHDHFPVGMGQGPKEAAC